MLTLQHRTLTALLLAPLALAATEPPPFRFDAPAGPQFSEAEKQFLRAADPGTGWLTSLRCAEDTHRVEFIRPGNALGAVALRVRSPGSPWRELSQSTNGVDLKSEFRPHGDALRMGDRGAEAPAT